MELLTKRFIESYEHLKTNGFIKDKSDFANKLDISVSMMTEITKGRSNPGGKALQNIVTIFNIDGNWLLTGDGEMIKKDLSAKQENNTFMEPESVYERIPVFNSPTTASQVEVYNDMNDEGPAFYVSIPQFKDCKFGKLVFGHSMYPTITSGSYVFCKQVSNKSRFIPGEIYYIEYDNFGVCKRLKKGDTPDEVRLVSDNEEEMSDGTRRYETYVLKIDQIRNMYLIKGFFNQNHN